MFSYLFQTLAGGWDSVQVLLALERTPQVGGEREAAPTAVAPTATTALTPTTAAPAPSLTPAPGGPGEVPSWTFSKLTGPNSFGN